MAAAALRDAVTAPRRKQAAKRLSASPPEIARVDFCATELFLDSIADETNRWIAETHKAFDADATIYDFGDWLRGASLMRFESKEFLWWTHQEFVLLHRLRALTPRQIHNGWSKIGITTRARTKAGGRRAAYIVTA